MNKQKKMEAFYELAKLANTMQSPGFIAALAQQGLEIDWLELGRIKESLLR